MKNLLITGGSQGIGKATALEAAKKGMFIGINYNSNDKAAEETLSEVKVVGGEGVILKCDVSQNSAVKDMLKNFVDTAGSLDGVFNNAGTTGPVSKIHELDPKDFKSLIDTNVIGAFNVAQESSKIMIKQKMGNIVNMTSIAADIGGAGEWVHYAMSKGAINSLTYVWQKN